MIDNIPFFTTQATIDDTVSARRDNDGALWFDGVVRQSRNSLLRVILNDQRRLDVVTHRLRELGCSMEYFGAYRLLTVNIPPNAKLAVVRRYLQTEHLAGLLDYEEPIHWGLDDPS